MPQPHEASTSRQRDSDRVMEATTTAGATPGFARWRHSCAAALTGGAFADARAFRSSATAARDQSFASRYEGNGPPFLVHSMADSWWGGKKQTAAAAAAVDGIQPCTTRIDTGAADAAAKASETEPDTRNEVERAFADYSGDEEFQTQKEQVEKWKDELLRTSPMIRFMVKHLGLVGCSPFADRRGPNGEPPIFPPFTITKCDTRSLGGFAAPRPEESPAGSGLVLCANNIHTKKELEHVFSHEMVHWWDACRFKVDFSNLRHHACTEIRASMLSGECSYSNESKRLDIFLGRGHFKKCIRRRATASLEANPDCPDRETAMRTIDEVFESCFSDTRPFDEVY